MQIIQFLNIFLQKCLVFCSKQEIKISMKRLIWIIQYQVDDNAKQIKELQKKYIIQKMKEKQRQKHLIIPHLQQLTSRLGRTHYSYQSLPSKAVRKPTSKRTCFELPTFKQTQAIHVSEYLITQNFKDSLRANLTQLQDIKRSYTHVSSERKKYIDIIDWLKSTLHEMGDKLDDISSANELRNIYSTAISEMIKEFKIQSSQKSRLLKLSWEAVMNVCCLEVKSLQNRLINLQKDLEKKHYLQRVQYEKEVKQYRDKIIMNAADLSQKQRYFYQVVTDNRVLRNRQRKLMNRLKHELQSNSYLKEQNMIFYKENEKMKMVLDSDDVKFKYKSFIQKFQALDKEFKNQKKKITRCNIIKELDDQQMRHKLGIKQEVNEIIRRVDVDDLLDLQIVEAPKVEELARLYYSAGVQTEPIRYDRATNTPSMFLGKKAVATQCIITERTKHFDFYKCDDIVGDILIKNSSYDLLQAYRQKNIQLRGNIQKQQLNKSENQRNKTMISHSRSFKKTLNIPRESPASRSQKSRVSQNKMSFTAGDFSKLTGMINSPALQHSESIKSKTQISHISRKSQNFQKESDRSNSFLKNEGATKREAKRPSRLPVPISRNSQNFDSDNNNFVQYRRSTKKSIQIFQSSSRKSKIFKFQRKSNVQEVILNEIINIPAYKQQNSSKMDEVGSENEDNFQNSRISQIQRKCSSPIPTPSLLNNTNDNSVSRISRISRMSNEQSNTVDQLIPSTYNITAIPQTKKTKTDAKKGYPQIQSKISKNQTKNKEKSETKSQIKNFKKSQSKNENINQVKNRGQNKNKIQNLNQSKIQTQNYRRAQSKKDNLNQSKNSIKNQNQNQSKSQSQSQNLNQKQNLNKVKSQTLDNSKNQNKIFENAQNTIIGEITNQKSDENFQEQIPLDQNNQTKQINNNNQQIQEGYIDAQLQYKQTEQIQKKAYFPPITIRISQCPSPKPPKKSIIKIEERESEQQISSNPSFCTNLSNTNRPPPSIQPPTQPPTSDRRYSRFCSLNMDKAAHLQNLQELTKLEISNIEDSQNPFLYTFQVTETYLNRMIKRFTKQILVHRQNLLKKDVSFQEFLDEDVDRSYGVGSLSIDIKDKVKESLRSYEGDNPQKLAYKYLLQGKVQSNSIDYKRYMFVLFLLSIQFWTLYDGVDNFVDLLADFIKDLLSKFCTMDIVNSFIKTNIVYGLVTSGSELFLSFKNLLQVQSTSLSFSNCIQKLQPILTNQNSLSLKELYSILSLIQTNHQLVLWRLKDISHYCIRKDRHLPIFKIVLILKKMGWQEALNLEQSLKNRFFQRFQFPTQNKIMRQIDLMSSKMATNQYVDSLVGMTYQQIKDHNMLIYYIVKLQYSNIILDSVVGEVIGAELSELSSLLSSSTKLFLTSK